MVTVYKTKSDATHRCFLQQTIKKHGRRFLKKPLFEKVLSFYIFCGEKQFVANCSDDVKFRF